MKGKTTGEEEGQKKEIKNKLGDRNIGEGHLLACKAVLKPFQPRPFDLIVSFC